MCVAVVVEADTPKQHELWQMDSHNPHGAGIAWCEGSLIKYRKGISWKDVKAVGDSLPRPWLLHFRWATHGGKIPRLTHPFPLGHKALSSFALTGTSEAVLIHNGTWSGYGRHVPARYRKVDFSDTAIAAFVAGTKGEAILDEVSWATAVMRAAGDGRVDVTLRGDWEQHDGNTYSNLHWQHNGWHKPIGFRTPLSTRKTGWIPEIAKRKGTAIDDVCDGCGERWFFYHHCRVSGEVLLSD